MPASTPQEIHFLFERAFNIGDVEAILALYEPGAVLVAGGKSVTGHDGIRDALRSHETRHTGRNRIQRRIGRAAWRVVARPTIDDARAEHGGRTPPTGRQLDVCHRQSEYAAIDFDSLLPDQPTHLVVSTKRRFRKLRRLQDL